MRRALLPGVELSPAGRYAVEVGLRQIVRLSTEIKMLGEEIRKRAQAELGCRALVEARYGVGPMPAFAIWSEMGDPRRFSSSSDAVRYAGIDTRSTLRTASAPRGTCRGKGPRSCAGRCMRRPYTRAVLPRLTMPTTRQ